MRLLFNSVVHCLAVFESKSTSCVNSCLISVNVVWRDTLPVQQLGLAKKHGDNTSSLKCLDNSLLGVLLTGQGAYIILHFKLIHSLLSVNYVGNVIKYIVKVMYFAHFFIFLLCVLLCFIICKIIVSSHTVGSISFHQFN